MSAGVSLVDVLATHLIGRVVCAYNLHKGHWHLAELNTLPRSEIKNAH